MSPPAVTHAHSWEHSRLLLQLAFAARLYDDAVSRWRQNAETEDANLYREVEAAMQTARMEYDNARLELEHHASLTRLRLRALSGGRE